MGGNLSKSPSESSSSYDMDLALLKFDSTLRARTSQVISSLAVGVEVQSLSFDSLRAVIERLLEMNREVVEVIFHRKEDIWKNQELFELVEEYFDISLQTMDFCTALVKCLKSARGSHLLIMVALQRFEEESELGENNYSRTLEELKAFKAAGSPFTEEFLQKFQSVYEQQISMFDKLKQKKKKLDTKLKYIRAGRKVSNIIFIATFASMLICSVVAAAIAAPPVAAALADAAANPLGSIGKWIDSLWENFENEFKGQKEILSSMHRCTGLTVKELENIRVLTDRLEMDIDNLMTSAEKAFEDGAVKLAIAEVKNKLVSFMKNVDDLGLQSDMCIQDIGRDRTVVLRRIIKPSYV